MKSSFLNKLNFGKFSPITIEETIYIDAPAEQVWNVTKDVDQWPKWNPSITAAKRLDDGPFGSGSVARIKQPLQPESEWTITEYINEDSFTWITRRTGLLMVATHHIRQQDSGTLNTLTLQASGIQALLLWPVLRIAIRHALKKENQGLKMWCEALPTSNT
jgi:uncharacterized protein YndB with AHSA1/START domain